MENKLPLNILINKYCNLECRFCVENTRKSCNKLISSNKLISFVNNEIYNGNISDILILGGEPTYHPDIIKIINKLNTPPILTTNGHRLIKDSLFLKHFCESRFKAINISIPHYLQNRREEITLKKSYSNIEARRSFNKIKNFRVNTLLIKNYIDSLEEIENMLDFCVYIGASEVKISELTAYKEDIHDFVSEDVLNFNREHYVPIPDSNIRNKCHQNGGTSFWKSYNGMKIYFNCPPDIAMSGGRDSSGKHYHRVLFNDGKIGYSWRRQDGVEDTEISLN